MMIRTATTLVVTAALLAVTVTAADARTRADQQYGMQEQQSSQRGGDWSHISGTIKKTKQVEARGQDQDNLVVQLQTNRGGKAIVDLGNVENLEDLDLQKGDRLTAWGRTVNIGDKRVFMAHKIQANDETVEIDRQQISERDRPQRGRTGDRYEFGMPRDDRSHHSSRGRQTDDRY